MRYVNPHTGAIYDYPDAPGQVMQQAQVPVINGRQLPPQLSPEQYMLLQQLAGQGMQVQQQQFLPNGNIGMQHRTAIPAGSFMQSPGIFQQEQQIDRFANETVQQVNNQPVQQVRPLQPVAVENKLRPFTVTPSRGDVVGMDNLQYPVLTTPLGRQSVYRYTVPCATSRDGAIENGVSDLYEGASDHDPQKDRIEAYIISTGYSIGAYNCNVAAINTDELYLAGIKNLYKTFRVLTKSVTDRSELCAVQFLNNAITGYINNYLEVAATIDVEIGSFATDFNDLLKTIRRANENIEDDMIDYLDYKLKKINPVKDGKNTAVVLPIKVVYITVLASETGLEPLTNVFSRFEKTPPNAFINSILDEAFKDNDNMDTAEVTIVTMDRAQFEVFGLLNAGETFIRRVQ